MDREILFRGKRIDNGEWVKGHLLIGVTGIHYIITLHDHILGIIEMYEVDPSTVGQYTGKSDMSGERAFEGDIIVPDEYTSDTATGIIRFGENRPDTSGGNHQEIGFWVEWKGAAADCWRNDLGYWLLKSRIVGNIHGGKDYQHE